MSNRELERARRRVRAAIRTLCDKEGDTEVRRTLRLSESGLANWKAGRVLPSLTNCLTLYTAYGLDLLHVALGPPAATPNLKGLK